MIQTQQHIIVSIFKAVLLTAVLMGGLVAQCYATTALFADNDMKSNTEVSLIEASGSNTQEIIIIVGE